MRSSAISSRDARGIYIYYLQTVIAVNNGSYTPQLDQMMCWVALYRLLDLIGRKDSFRDTPDKFDSVRFDMIRCDAM